MDDRDVNTRSLADEAGRKAEVEAAYRDAIAAGDSTAWNSLGNLLSDCAGREDEAEAAYGKAIAAGDPLCALQPRAAPGRPNRP